MLLELDNHLISLSRMKIKIAAIDNFQGRPVVVRSKGTPLMTTSTSGAVKSRGILQFINVGKLGIEILRVSSDAAGDSGRSFGDMPLLLTAVRGPIPFRPHHTGNISGSGCIRPKPWLEVPFCSFA
jgi:hypothetical protein